MAAAVRIIASDGIDALTMRRLADEAGVSSRTPYNLFESKTDILTAIMLEAMEPLQQHDAQDNQGLALADLVQHLEALLALNQEKQAFFRSVHWSIMRSDDVEAKLQGRLVLNRLIGDHIDEAMANGELKPDCDATSLALHISTLLAAILGMWADQQLSLREAVGHTRHAWSNSLMPHARGKALRYLKDTEAGVVTGEYPEPTGKVA